MKTPLERFIENLKHRHSNIDNSSNNKVFKCDDIIDHSIEPPSNRSYPRHTTRSTPNTAESEAFKCDAKCDQPVTLGSMICWQGPDGVTRGPARVQEITAHAGRTWFWVELDGVARWVSEVIVTNVVPADGA